MNTEPSMKGLVEEYLDHRQQLGYALKSEGQLLLQFAAFAERIEHQGPLTTELAVRWARLPEKGSASYLANWLNVVRCFARYRAIFDIKTEIPPHDLLGVALRRTTPYIFTPAEINALLREARSLPPADSLRPHTYATLFALLACTGLRHRETLRLTRSDVDWKQHLLHVRKTKFRKSRFVPLHPSAIQALDRYARLRDQHYPLARCDAFFISMQGTALGQSTVQGVFGTLRKSLTWRGCPGRRLPRIHDLRHTFACSRLLHWYEQGMDVDHAIAALSTYLGHADVNDTYWYLTGVPELLELVGNRLECFILPKSGDEK
jgi:integrase